MKQTENTLSEIYAGNIYISSMKIAKDYQLLWSLKIFNILNAAGDYCQHDTDNDFVIISFNIRDN